MSAEIPSVKESHTTGPESQLGGRALQGSMVRAWVQGGEENRSCECNPATTAFTCNRVTFRFIVKLIQATSLHTANIYPSPPWERPSSCRKSRENKGIGEEGEQPRVY